MDMSFQIQFLVAGAALLVLSFILSGTFIPVLSRILDVSRGHLSLRGLLTLYRCICIGSTLSVIQLDNGLFLQHHTASQTEMVMSINLCMALRKI